MSLQRLFAVAALALMTEVAAAQAEVIGDVRTQYATQQPAAGPLLLRFQLIEASSGNVRDPAIAGIDSVLRDLFRFTGYALLSQAAVTTNYGASASQMLSGRNETLQLDLRIGPQSTSGGRGANAIVAPSGTAVPPGAVVLTVTLTSNPVVMSVPPTGANVALQRKVAILQTTVTIMPGQTVVLGSTQPPGSGNALILAVKAEQR